MNKINLYLFKLSWKYFFINLLILSIFIIFLNLIELSRILEKNENNFLNYSYLTFLKLPAIINEVFPFVVIISTSFLLRNLINNNEFISMRNIGYSIFNIFYPIGISIFILGLIFLFLMNPLAANFENKYEQVINKKDQSLYSIKIINNEMWIKNNFSKNYKSFIKIENINFKNMNVKNIKILLIEKNNNKYIQASHGNLKENILSLNDVKYYNVNDEIFKELKNYDLEINFTRENILSSVINYKLIPFYKYFNHTKTLQKFNLYSPEIGLFYISEILKPFFIVILSFIVIGFSGKFKRNENFFKVLFFSILVGFLIFFFKEIITKLTITLSINFFISYATIFFIPFIIGLYQIIKIEND